MRLGTIGRAAQSVPRPCRYRIVLLIVLQLTVFGRAHAAPPPTANRALEPGRAGALAPFLDPNKLSLRSGSALIMDAREGALLFAKDIYTPRPIASLTKLMTAMVILDAQLPLEEPIAITPADRDQLRGSRSRLSLGTVLTRRDALKIALAASDNRAAAALARTYPGGTAAFVTAMNAKARQLGLAQTRFQDSAGLHDGNVSTAAELATLVGAAYRYPLIRQLTTVNIDAVTDLRSGWKVRFMNTNRLVRGNQWDIGLSKTGYIADSGHCLLMRTTLADRPVTVVLLNSWGKLSRFGDANRIKLWFERAAARARQASLAVGPMVARAGPPR